MKKTGIGFEMCSDWKCNTFRDFVIIYFAHYLKVIIRTSEGLYFSDALLIRM